MDGLHYSWDYDFEEGEGRPKEEDEKVVRLKNPRDDLDNDDDDVCKAAKVDLVCTNCHLWRPNEQLPRGASLLVYSMLLMLFAMLYSQFSTL